jgi:hypothetical protein
METDMNYYRLSFCKITAPDPAKPLSRLWEWFALVHQAETRGAAKVHGLLVAADQNVRFVDAIRLPKVIGIVEIAKNPIFRKIA